MKEYNYAIVGNIWGKKIFSILKQKKKNCFIVNLDYREISLNVYIDKLLSIIKEKKIDIIWLAIPPENQFKISKAILMADTNIIIEKPLILKKKEKNDLHKLSIIKSKKISIHFEYIFLNELTNFDYNIDFNHIELIFNQSDKKKKLNPNLDLGSHLIAIKNIYFKNKSFKIKTAFSTNDNRRIVFKNDSRIVYVINFTNSKEPIIQKFVDYYENKVMKGVENKLSIDFAYNVTNEINNLE